MLLVIPTFNVNENLHIHQESFLQIKKLIESIDKLTNASNVMIFRESLRFENEIHDHKEKLRSSNELLSVFQKSWRIESVFLEDPQ